MDTYQSSAKKGNLISQAYKEPKQLTEVVTFKSVSLHKSVAMVASYSFVFVYLVLFHFEHISSMALSRYSCCTVLEHTYAQPIYLMFWQNVYSFYSEFWHIIEKVIIDTSPASPLAYSTVNS
ncbi:hypothetical protein PHYBLDRAFT_69165 [Phycomyces blakesleeanus NRRL 1555(-)]|uniref:Uncharacterized protein n=1 Tax=Phycomyces blakesleeanus (strain ATCC 8743b / DSM 1359 / FGSC 10004 / NBRC 33097 / NRRL 1555) TaxID=763407 RepID=A0A162ZNR3_PHYB8|nr:hypothetical protein PHYBLDRAFT_69165 [Phycomyces blakesleeanus NRRL 1555(-)]OAD68091.1 hypothetical protein PHYBLDRAFT_69165 [Phycomyces blakesleeanus NRRL 1555(-)]|eukprot:XP_018286131.1 hypothetical protein PHYBLDRAFT_69165 [Phycomyces blakesleeanus NRRL 1555(-)]